MRITKIFALLLVLVMILLSVPVTASVSKDIDLIESTNNYINGGLDSASYSDYLYNYEQFIDYLEEDNLYFVASVLTEGTIGVDFQPSLEDYVDTISNMIAISESEDPNDISAQKQFDHLKDGSDYVKDAISICVDAYSLVSEFSDDDTVKLISDTISNIDKYCDAAENAVSLISNLETATEQYVRYDRILKEIEENADGDMREAASLMRKSLNSYYEYAVGEYTTLAIEGVYDIGSTIFDFNAEDLKNNLTVEEKKLWDKLDNFNLLKDSFELGAEGALFLGNVILNTEDMITRIREIYAVSELNDVLGDINLKDKEAFLIAYDNGDATRELCENYLSTVDYMYSNRRRGEYCFYSLMKNDMGVLSWFFDSEEIDGWYQKFLDFITLRELWIEKAKYDPEGYEIHTYQVFDGVASTWEEAESYCRSLGGHLATIGGYEENMHVYNLMKDAGYNSAYIGLYETASGAWKWSNGEPVIYTNWGGTEPNNEGGDEKYGMFYYKFGDGSWNDGDFDNTVSGGKAFICEWD